MARSLAVEIIGDARSLDRALKGAETTTKGFGRHVSNLGKVAVGAAGAAGVGALIYGVKTGISEFMQAQKVTAQTNAVIKSTGGVANVSAKEIQGLAGSIMKKSGIDDEAVQSGENMLLTFTNIRNEVGKGNDIFNQATNTLADLSVATGKDMAHSAVMLGKALNDPIKGVGALARVGVTFTAGQKEQIKALTESGKTMEAQKIILGELNKEFGGSAEALGKTLPGQINIVREQFNNWTGEMVAKAIPVIQRFVAFIREHWPEISETIKRVWERDIEPTLTALIDLVVEVVQTIRRHWGTIGPIVEDAAKVIERIVDQIVGALRLVTAILRGDWSAAWKELKGMVSNALGLVKDVVTLQGDVLEGILKGLGNALKAALVAGLTGIGNAAWGVINNVGDAVSNNLGNAGQWMRDMANRMKNALVDQLVGIGNAAWGVVNNVGSVIAENLGAAGGWGRDVADRIKSGVKNGLVGIGADAWEGINNIGSFLVGVKDRITGWGGDVAGWIKSGIVAGFKGIGSAIESALKSAINSVISAWNSLEIPGFTINLPRPVPDVHVPGIPLPNIPHLAKGGPLLASQFAIVGERGPELFVPNRAGAVVPMGNGGAVGGTTIVVNVSGSLIHERELGDRIAEALRLKARRDGPLQLG